MIEKRGDVFTTNATYIGHGVNCVGVMGAGIAKTIKEKFPKVYQEYRWLCDANGLHLGDFFPYPENDKMIVNFATQNKPGPDATYEAVFNSLYKFSVQASHPARTARYGNRIAIPEIGCGIGGLEWDKVQKIIWTIEHIVPEIKYEVWHYK